MVFIIPIYDGACMRPTSFTVLDEIQESLDIVESTSLPSSVEVATFALFIVNSAAQKLGMPAPFPVANIPTPPNAPEVEGIPALPEIPKVARPLRLPF